MQRVRELYEELGAGQQKLYLEVRKRKIQVTRSQGNEFVAKQGERQVFTQPLPQAKGQTAAEDVNARYMLDVVFVRDLIVVFLVKTLTRNTTIRSRTKTTSNIYRAFTSSAAVCPLAWSNGCV